MDIEEVADKKPEAIFTEVIDSLPPGCIDFQMRTIAFNLGLQGKAYKEMIPLHKQAVGGLRHLRCLAYGDQSAA
ncbi:MAG: hypothetical protein MZV63_52875 [Marinilabiliales bacterium]|nr:hypothetical protein [Marinilabiliales bacterium]